MQLVIIVHLDSIGEYVISVKLDLLCSKRVNNIFKVELFNLVHYKKCRYYPIFPIPLYFVFLFAIRNFFNMPVLLLKTFTTAYKVHQIDMNNSVPLLQHIVRCHDIFFIVIPYAL